MTSYRYFRIVVRPHIAAATAGHTEFVAAGRKSVEQLVVAVAAGTVE